MITHILFPSQPGYPNRPDESFTREYTAAKKAGFSTALIDVEFQLGGEVNLRNLPDKGSVLYRGWLVKNEHYQRLSDAIEARGCRFAVPPPAYRNANELPLWYGEVQFRTPISTWFPETPNSTTEESVRDLAEEVGDTFDEHPILLKDYVKSRKQDWFDACFIPNPRDLENVVRVVKNFHRLTEDSRVGGLVFREFLPLKRVEIHPKSGMPLVNEHRAFFFEGSLFYQTPYWADGSYEGMELPPRDWVEATTQLIQSPFFTADVAQLEDGSWTLIEIGDGGVSGLPNAEDADIFYTRLSEVV